MTQQTDTTRWRRSTTAAPSPAASTRTRCAPTRRALGRGTNGVSANLINGVAASFMLFDRWTSKGLLLTYLFTQPVETHNLFAAAPLVLTPFVRSRGIVTTKGDEVDHVISVVGWGAYYPNTTTTLFNIIIIISSSSSSHYPKYDDHVCCKLFLLCPRSRNTSEVVVRRALGLYVQ